MTLVDEIKACGRQIGFDLIGISQAQPSQYQDYFRQWLAAGRNGTMHWLANRVDERIDPANYFPGAKSIISVAVNYRVKVELSPDPGHGRIAQYALGEDYHVVMKQRLHQLADWLRGIVPGVDCRASVDTAPVMEKEISARAGVGWMGKNTCLINEKIGSFILLGQIMTTLDLPSDEPADDRCGSCTKCIDACPTDALGNPYQMDASKCISYLTIEHRGEVDPALSPQIGHWLYGCDICQDVCPWNRKSPLGTDEAFQSRFPGGSLKWQKVLDWSEQDYRTELKGSAIKRVKLPMFKRNAQIVANNSAGRDA